MRPVPARSTGALALAAAALAIFAAATCAAQLYQAVTIHDIDLLANGNILVTDGGTPSGGAGIYEIDRVGSIVWSYTSGLAWAHNADRQPDGSVIISDTNHDRVIIIDSGGSLTWDSHDIPLSDGSSLDYPNDANLLTSGNRLITDRNNHRVIESDPSGSIVWQFGQTGVPGNDSTHLNSPHNADRLANGNTIIADSNNDRVIEVAPDGSIVWLYSGGLNLPRDADRLAGGNTIINDTQNQRIIEVTPAGSIVWEHPVDGTSYDSDRLDSGNTLFGTRGTLFEVDPSGTTVWSYPVVYETQVVEGYLVTAPNQNRVWTKIIQPRTDLYPDQSFPGVVSVSGGLGAGENGNANLAAYGFVEFHFNAEGRGVLHPSDGEEDYNGFIHQDDLKAVIEFALSRPNVIPDNVGVITSSYGITMGAGCLGRYPDLPVQYLIDVEGPSESYVTCFEPWSLDSNPANDRIAQGYAIFGHWSTSRDPSQANLDWWGEREAVLYIGNIRCRYLRVQAEWDHAQPPNAQWPGFDYPPLWYPNKHAVDLVNLATAGQAPWTRVNGGADGNPPNTTFSRENPPVYYSGSWNAHREELLGLGQEMAGMDPVVSVGDQDAKLPRAAVLHPSYPNPFNPQATITFELARTSRVELAVYDLRGARVRTLASRVYAAGRHQVFWNGRGDDGVRAASGVYTARLKAANERHVVKLVLVK